MAFFDFRNKISRNILERDLRRATPIEWNDYCTSREMIRIFNRQRPGLIFDRLSGQSFALKRPNRIFFYDNSRTSKGKQCFPNRAAHVSRKLDFDWHFTVLNNDALRV